MLGDIAQYLKDPNAAKRQYVATEDKSWCAQDVDSAIKIAEVEAIDPRAAIVLKIMDAFALRIREAASLHPHEADLGTALNVSWGTKSKRPRVLPIENEYQRQVIEEAKRFANKSTGSLIPDGFKRNTWLRRLYRIFDSCGIGRKHGIVPHGLRHQRANDMFQDNTGQKSPVRGGTALIDKQLDNWARLVVAEALGHSRKQISSAYLGSFLKERKQEREEMLSDNQS
jgi:integrase